MINPFSQYDPAICDVLTDSRSDAAVKAIKLLEKENLVYITGEHGTGKTAVCSKVFSYLMGTGKKVILVDSETSTFSEILEAFMRDADVIIVDNAEMLAYVPKDKRETLRRAVEKWIKEGRKIVVACEDTFLDRVDDIFGKGPIVSIPKASKEEILAILETRVKFFLGENKSLKDLFTDKEIEKILKNCYGNPKLALMIAEDMFEAKMRKEEKKE